jgi:hypothetical protein
VRGGVPAVALTRLPGTSIEDIAAEAGVARPTVFAAVGFPKPVILRTVVDEALAGDDAGADRRAAWWRRR